MFELQKAHCTTRSGGGTAALRPPVSAGAGTIFQRALAPSGWCLPGSCRNTRLRVYRPWVC